MDKMRIDELPPFNRKLAAMLRAGCLDLAERAEEIVGAVDLHQELRVTIAIGSKSGEITWPSVEIEHRVLSRPMIDAMKERD